MAGYLKFDFALRLCIVLNAEEHLTIGGLSDDATAVKGLVIIIQPHLGDDGTVEMLCHGKPPLGLFFPMEGCAIPNFPVKRGLAHI